ncbi:MAG: hypothetical protein AB1407_03610 [Spirochaetota bacterium]
MREAGALRTSPGTSPGANLKEKWKGLFLCASISSILMFAFIIVQILVYSIWSPPGDAEGMYRLMRENWLLGLLSMDFLYIVDCVLLAIIYLGVYMAVRDWGESSMLIATVLGLLGIAAYFASNPVFEMLYLGRTYDPALPQEARSAMLGAGRGFMETYKGTAFNIYYVLNTVYLFLATPVMRKSGLFSRATIISGFAAAVLMVIPSSAGTLGIVFSLASLVPWMFWLFQVSKVFRKLST